MIKHYLTLCFSITIFLGSMTSLSANHSSKIISEEIAPPCNITFTQQPEDVFICPGVFAQFKGVVTCNEELNILYQWQVSPNTSNVFTDIALFTDNYDGPTTAQLSIEDVNGLTGYRYRLCVFAEGCDRVYSNVVTLRNLISQQPQDMEICTGDPAIFSVFLNDNNLDVQWQVATGSGASFTPLTDNVIYQNTQTPHLTITDVTGLDGFYYQAIINSDDCQVLSEPALLTVIPQPIIQDAIVTMCSNVQMEIDLQEFLTGVAVGLDLQYEVTAIDSGLSGVPLGTTGLGNPMHTWINNGTTLGTVTYTITAVNPQNGCEDISFELILRIFPLPQVTLDPGGDLNVCPEDFRILSSTITNGPAPYTHLWNILSQSGTAMATLDGAAVSTNATPFFTGTGTGTVKVQYIVIDANGCFSVPQTLTFHLGLPTILQSISGNLTPCTGSLETYSVLASENVYQWEVSAGGQIVGSANNSNVNILWTGQGGTSATLSVTAGSGCTVMETTQIFIQEQPEIEVQSLDITCFGENDGIASIFIDGVLNPPNSSYEWSNGLMTATGSGLSAGDYMVTVTNENNCTEVVSFDITEPDLLTTLVLTAHVSCEGNEDGAATVFVSGGTPDYTYLWSNGSTDMTLFNLAQGVYFVTVTDANGCQRVDEAVIHLDDPLTAEVTVIDATCENSGLGSAVVTVTGGTAPYTYKWFNEDGQVVSTTDSATGLEGGNYAVVILDQNGCSFTKPFAVEGEDLEAPELTCFASEAYIANLDAMGQVRIHIQDVIEEVSDNCGVEQVTFDNGTRILTFDCTDLQVPQTITLVAEDINGNTSTCSRLVLVQDLILPTIDCEDNHRIALYLNQNGQASLTAADIVTTADNCGVSWVRFASGVLTQNYNCGDVGIRTETIIVTDASGNAASCTLEVEVIDQDTPILDCGNGPIYIDLENHEEVTLNVQDLVTVSDNCTIISLTFQNGQSTISFNCQNFSHNSQAIVTAQDASNNATTCILNVEISPDSGLPETNCSHLPHLLPLEANGTRTLNAADLVEVEGDDCLLNTIVFLDGMTERTYDCSDVGDEIVVTVMIRGFGTESDSCTREIKVTDPLHACGD